MKIKEWSFFAVFVFIAVSCVFAAEQATPPAQQPAATTPAAAPTAAASEAAPKSGLDSFRDWFHNPAP